MNSTTEQNNYTLIGTFTTEGKGAVMRLLDGSQVPLEWNPLRDDRIVAVAKQLVYDEAQTTGIDAEFEELDAVSGSVYLRPDGTHRFVVECVDAYVERSTHSWFEDEDGLCEVLARGLPPAGGKPAVGSIAGGTSTEAA